MKKEKATRITQEFMADVVIEKGIKMPTTFKRGIQFPFEDMEVGDSFWQNNITRTSLAAKAREYAKNNVGNDGHMQVFIFVDERDGVRCFRRK